MRYALIENAIVDCSDINNYTTLDTSHLFQRKDFFEEMDYEPVLKSILSFINKQRCNEIIISSIFYTIPCFVLVLQKKVGEATKLIPLYELLGNENTVEVYDHYTIETKRTHGVISSRIIQKDLLSKIRNNNTIQDFVKETGIDTIITINNYLNNNDAPVTQLSDVSDFISDYDKILENKNNYIIFSPYGALKFYDEIIPGICDLESIKAMPYKTKSPKTSFNVSLHNKSLAFDNKFQSWFLMEPNIGIDFYRSFCEEIKKATFFLPNHFLERTEILNTALDLRFSKYYLDIECDYLGNLHIQVESLDNKIVYTILCF